ncbi:MAG: SDR family oxidoreductase [Clostridia bacterium]|nr:SDR family oxidoreductase [Clostridia bacterium]
MERKVCFITGSGSGNGRSMAIRFAELGYDICLHHSGRDPEGAERTRALIASKGVECKVLVENLAESGAAQRLFEKFRAEYDRLDIFINNSGITDGGPIMKTDEAMFNKLVGVNFRACYFCVAEAGKFMREKGIEGSITLIASNHHRVNFRGGFSVYASLKSAMVRFTKWAALEFSHYKIRVNCIAPGYIVPIYEKHEFDLEQYIKHVEPRLPLKRMVPPSELADLAEFLASPSGRSITGQTIDVDGGDSLLNAPLESYRFEE